MSDDSVSDPSDAPSPMTGSVTQGDTGPAATNTRSSDPPAISDDTVQRYYYIYDSRAGRPLVQDRMTQAPYVWDDDPRTPVLQYAASRAPDEPDEERAAHWRDRLSRRFALWCARQTTAAVHSEEGENDEPSSESATTDVLVRAAQDLITSPGNERVPSIRAAVETAVIHASTIGLSEMDPAAAALLTAFGATHPDPRTAALEAAHMGERYAEFVAYHRHNGADTPLPPAVRDRHDRRPGPREETPVPDAAARLMREAHIDWLLEESVGR